MVKVDRDFNFTETEKKIQKVKSQNNQVDYDQFEIDTLPRMEIYEQE